jgi:hypothetical protein
MALGVGSRWPGHGLQILLLTDLPPCELCFGLFRIAFVPAGSEVGYSPLLRLSLFFQSCSAGSAAGLHSFFPFLGGLLGTPYYLRSLALGGLKEFYT